MREIIEKLEHGIMVCHATETTTVHMELADADKILALLKEQEAISVVQREVMHNMLVSCCGSCGVAITNGDKFCRMCGKPVKWK